MSWQCHGICINKRAYATMYKDGYRWCKTCDVITKENPCSCCGGKTRGKSRMFNRFENRLIRLLHKKDND